MRAFALPLLSLALIAACADPPAPAAPTKSTAEAAPPKTAEPRYADLRAEDCQAWADQFAARVKEATQRRVDECSSKVKAAGGTPTPEVTKDKESADLEADRLHGMILEQCGQQVGAAYVRSDAACYMSAKKLEDWKSCPFESMFFSDYKAAAKNHEKMFDDRCQTELKKVAGSKSPSAG